MNLLGYIALFLCVVLAVYGQNDISTPDSEPNTDPSVTTPSAETETAPSTATPAPSTATPSTTPSANTTTNASTAAPVTTPSAGPETTAPSTAEPDTTTSAGPETTAPSTAEPDTTPSAGPETTVPSTEPPKTTPTPTAAPSSTAAPSYDLNLYVNNTGNFCILMDMEIELTIEYTNATGTKVSNSYQLTEGDITVDEEKSSFCNKTETEEHLVANIKNENELFVQFNKTDNKVSINLFRIKFSNIKDIFDDAQNINMTLESTSKLFEFTDSKSYKCDAATKVPLVDEEGKATNSFVTFKMVKVQAFGTSNSPQFAAAEDCVQDDNVSDIVPIAVGCALAALVVIVLIAYLVGRRQKRQRGYESV